MANGLYGGDDGREYCYAHVKMVKGRQAFAESMFKKDAMKTAKAKAPPPSKPPPSPDESSDDGEEEEQETPVPALTEVRQLTVQDSSEEDTDAATTSSEGEHYQKLKSKKKQLKRELKKRYKKRAKEAKKKRQRTGIDRYKEVGAADTPQKRWKRALRNSRSIATLGRDSDVPKTRLLDHRF